MVCRTRLILEQTGLTCCCRSQGLLSLLCKTEVGGGGLLGKSTSPDSGAQQALLPPPLRVNRWPSHRKCAGKARDQRGLESGVV